MSKARSDFSHNEVLVAADPHDRTRLLIGSKITYKPNEIMQSLAYASFDGGKTWEVAVERKANRRATDPAVAFGPHGVAYFATIGPGRLLLYQSADGGKNWSEPANVDPKAEADREYIAVDHSRGKFDGRVYYVCYVTAGPLGGTEGRPGLDPAGPGSIVLYHSTDGGRSFPPASLHAVRTERPPYVSNGAAGIVVASDGTVIVLYSITDKRGLGPNSPGPSSKVNPEGPKSFLVAHRSSDGGLSFEDGYGIVGSWYYAYHENQGQFPGIPTLAIDPGSASFKDCLYAVWSNVLPMGRQVMFSRSRDKGLTWSKAEKIGDAPAKGSWAAQHSGFFPSVAVNKSGGIGVSWYDSRDLPEGANGGWDVRFRYSANGGDSWEPSVRVTERSTVGAVGPGDTAGLAAAADGTFHPVWIDGRSGTPQVWTATVQVSNRQ